MMKWFNKIFRKSVGYSLLEVTMTMTLTLIMVGSAAYYARDTLQLGKASSLKQTLSETRKAIDAFYKSNSRYPNNLDELVYGSTIYLRSMPFDPTSNNGRWLIIMESGETCFSDQPYTGLYDIRSTNYLYYNL